MVRDTSVQAFKDLLSRGVISKRQEIVLCGFDKYGPCTDRELAEFLGFDDPNAVRPRRKELLDLGLLVEFEKRACGVSGRTVWSWCVVGERVVSKELVGGARLQFPEFCRCCGLDLCGEARLLCRFCEVRK